MREEIQLETFAQQRIIQIDHFARPGRARVRDQNIHPAKARHTGVNRLLRRPLGRDVQRDTVVVRPQLRQPFVQGFVKQIDQQDIGTQIGKGLCRGQPDCPATAGDDHRMTGKARIVAGWQFGLFQRPVFHVEQIFFAHGVEAATVLAHAHGGDVLFRQIGSDARLACICAHADDADPFDPCHVRHRVQHDLAATNAGIVAFKIGSVISDIGVNSRGNRIGTTGQRLFGQHQREILGTDHVIRRCYPAFGQFLPVATGQKFLHVFTCPQVHNRHECIAVAQKFGATFSKDTAQSRHYLNRFGLGCHIRRTRQFQLATHLLRHPILDHIYMGDHPVISQLRAVAKGEMPVVQQ